MTAKKLNAKNLCLLCVSVAVILMLTPWGVSFVTAPGPDTRVVSTRSYLSIYNMFWAGNYIPILTFILTVIGLLWQPRGQHKGLLIAALLSNSLQLIFFSPITIVGVIIELLLAAAIALCFFGRQEN